MFRRVLIANRGEIALRLVRACRDLGLESAVLFPEADRTTLAVRLADVPVPLAGSDPRAAYLDVPRVLEAARRAGADAVHPGYGFLSENAEFARACESEGLTFIGPPPEAIERLGPIFEWNRMHHGSYHLFGHVHGSQTIPGRAIDVGIDNRPQKDMGLWSWEELDKILSKREIRMHHQKFDT